jgi:hypothetical protein
MEAGADRDVVERRKIIIFCVGRNKTPGALYVMLIK